jgi:hypothetical protein
MYKTMNAYCCALGLLFGVALTPLFGCSSSNCHGPETEDCHDEGAAGAGSSSTQGGGGVGGESAADPVLDYCNCMLLTCHDEYHQAFGPETDEPQARVNCLADSAMLPQAGMDVDTGNFVECRLHHCEVGKTDVSACPNTIGAMCM